MEKEDKEKFIKKIKDRLLPLNLEKLNIKTEMSSEGYECEGFGEFVKWIQYVIIDDKSEKSGKPKEYGKLFWNEHDYCRVTNRAILGWIKTQEIINKIETSLILLKQETKYFYNEKKKEDLANDLEKVWEEVNKKFAPENNKAESRSEKKIKRLKEKIIRELRSCLGLLVISNYVTSEKNFEDLKKIDVLLKDFKNN